MTIILLPPKKKYHDVFNFIEGEWHIVSQTDVSSAWRKWEVR
jgi:hypothetical protein